MRKELGSPLRMEFDGWDADGHRVEALQFGRSLQGAARLYRSAYNFYFTGKLPARLQRSNVRVLVGPPSQGSLSYLLWLLIAHGQLAVYPELLYEFSDLFVPDLVKGALAKLSKQDSVADESIERMFELAKDNTAITRQFIEYASDVEEGHQRDKKYLYNALKKVTSDLAKRNANSAIELVEPIGKSVRQLTHAKGQNAEFVIDEPSAVVIRSQGTLEIGEARQIKVQLGAVDVISRTCKILSDELTKPLRGKITDPAIEITGNVYTNALNQGNQLIITGKPVIKDGEIVTFYISDARPI